MDTPLNGHLQYNIIIEAFHLSAPLEKYRVPIGNLMVCLNRFVSRQSFQLFGGFQRYKYSDILDLRPPFPQTLYNIALFLFSIQVRQYNKSLNVNSIAWNLNDDVIECAYTGGPTILTLFHNFNLFRRKWEILLNQKEFKCD